MVGGSFDMMPEAFLGVDLGLASCWVPAVWASELFDIADEGIPLASQEKVTGSVVTERGRTR